MTMKHIKHLKFLMKHVQHLKFPMKHVQHDIETCATSQIFKWNMCNMTIKHVQHLKFPMKHMQHHNETCATSWVKFWFPCYLAQISSSRQIWNPMFQCCNMDVSLVHFSMSVEQFETPNDFSWKSDEYQSWITHQDL
jgi:hypothetical protein